MLLHGYGADERDLLPLATELDPRFLVVSVRAPRALERGAAWFHLDFRKDGGVVPDLAQGRATLADFVRWLEAAPTRLGADAQRVHLLGFSQGAMMSLGVLLTAPERVAGVVALSGVPADDLVTAPATAAAVARVPVFVAHGTGDTLLPVAEGRTIRRRLEELGTTALTYREYPIRHSIAPAEVQDVATWLAGVLDRSKR